MFTGKNRDFAKRRTGTDDVQDLLFSLEGYFEYLNPSRDNHIKSVAVITLGKDHLIFLYGFCTTIDASCRWFSSVSPWSSGMVASCLSTSIVTPRCGTIETITAG